MRSILVVSVLALLLLDYAELAPQNIGRILRNSSLDESEAARFESEKIEDAEIANAEDNSPISTLETVEHSSTLSDYETDSSAKSLEDSPPTLPSEPSTESQFSSQPVGNDASDPNNAGKELFLTTSGSTGSSKQLIPEDTVKEVSPAFYVGISSESEEIGIEDSANTTNLPKKNEPNDSSIVDPKITEFDSKDDRDDGREQDFKKSDDENDYEGEGIRRSDEFIENQDDEQDEYLNTSTTLPGTSSLPEKVSLTSHGASDKLVLNSAEIHEDFEEINDNTNPSENQEDERTVFPVTATEVNDEVPKFRNEELRELTTVPEGIEKAVPTEKSDTSLMTDRNEELTFDTFSPTAESVGLRADEDALRRTTPEIPTTTSTFSEESATDSTHPGSSFVFEGRNAFTSSEPADAFTGKETTNQQIGSELPKSSDDAASIVTTLSSEQSTFPPSTVSLLENTETSRNASSETRVSSDFTSSPEGRSGELTSEGLTSQGDQTVSINPEEPTSFPDDVQTSKSTQDENFEISDGDHFSTVVDETLPQSDANLNTRHAGMSFPTSSAPMFEVEEKEEPSLELKIIDAPVDNSDKFDTNTPSEDRTTAPSFSAADSKEPLTTRERTTTLIWRGPTVLPRLTTTLSETTTRVTATETVPMEDEVMELKQGDGKDVLNTRFSDRYLSGNNTDMVAAVQFLHYHDKASSEQCFKLVDAHWNYATNLTEENKRKQLQQTLEYSLFHKSAWKNATSFAWKSFNDTLIKRWFKSLSILGNAALPEDKLTEFNQLKAEMKNTYSTAKVCPYKNPEDGSSSVPEKCNLSLEPDLQSILMKSRDYDELVHVWKSWRDVAGKPIREKFLRFVELSNEAAALNGFPDTGDMWREAYESDTFQQELEILWEQLRPLYEHLHAYVRRKLINEYGSDKVREDGPIPAHLFGNMWAQSWVSLLDITQPFPGKPSVDVTPTMAAKNMTALDMFQVSEEFFTSLGLKSMPEEFWKHSLIEKPKGREIICHASAWDFCNGKDYRIKQCTVITMEDLITVHHEMGHIQYFMQYARQPNVFREGANPGFHEAIGDVLALSVSTPSHLLSIGLLDEIADDPEGDLNFLLRTALEKVSFLPSGYLIDLWRWGLFSGEIKSEEMNRKWWELRLKYQGICPPVKRTEEDFDPGAKYHVAGNVPYIRYFVSFVIQFQFHKVLCDAAGHTGPLYKCDIYRSKEAGQILSQVMELGSSEHWSEAMRIMTGGAQTKMDAQPIMEYFEPLLKWLIEQNKNETLGWRSDDATICP